jgi:hypothetical protein
MGRLISPQRGNHTPPNKQILRGRRADVTTADRLKRCVMKRGIIEQVNFQLVGAQFGRVAPLSVACRLNPPSTKFLTV